MKLIILKPETFDKAWIRALPVMRTEHGILVQQSTLIISSEHLQIGTGDTMPLPDGQFSYSQALDWSRKEFQPNLFNGDSAGKQEPSA